MIELDLRLLYGVWKFFPFTFSCSDFSSTQLLPTNRPPSSEAGLPKRWLRPYPVSENRSIFSSDKPEILSLKQAYLSQITGRRGGGKTLLSLPCPPGMFIFRLPVWLLQVKESGLRNNYIFRCPVFARWLSVFLWRFRPFLCNTRNIRGRRAVSITPGTC